MAFLDSTERREERLAKVIEPGHIISRNTYNLALGGFTLYGLLVNLILCTIPAVTELYYTMNPIVFLIGYFALCWGGIALSKNSDNPLVSFLGYNMVCCPMGVVVSACVTGYGGIGNELVQQAFLITCIVAGVMTAASMAYPQFFDKLGGTLFVVLISLIVVEIVLLLLGIEQIVTSWVAAILFSFYIGFDFYRSQQFEPCLDNAVDCALDIYVDLINLFIRILRILASSKKRD